MHIRTRLLVYPRPIPDIHLVNPSAYSSSSMKIFLTLFYKSREMRFYQAHHGREARLVDGFSRQPISVSFWLDICALDGYDAVDSVLSPMLRRLEITDPLHSEAVVRRIMYHVVQITRWVSRKRKVLPLVMDIERVTKIVCSERDLVERAVRVSRMEFERRRNYGMVPTAKRALKLRCVKVKKKEGKVGGETEEYCSICLERLREFAAKMPCNHKFHGICIAEWLKTSHYCPVCRFEMPTESDMLIDDR